MSGVSEEDETFVTPLQSKGTVSHILLPAFRRQRHGRSSGESLAMLRCMDLCSEPRSLELADRKVCGDSFPCPV